MSKKSDLTGMRFGKLTVLRKLDSIRYASGRTATQWECKCDCGNIFVSITARLNSGKSIQCDICAHSATGLSHRNDYVGKRFGKLIVKEMLYNYNNSNRTKCLCDCDCGKKNIIKNQYEITSGKIKSCGCIKGISQRKCFLGQKFGKLTVIEEIFNPPNNNKVKCICECGNELVLSRRDVTTGHTNSCGCIKRSLREEYIEDLLIEYGCNYKTQYTFNDCKSDKNYVLRYDFGILNNDGSLNCIIEYDGQQHFYPIEGWGGEETYLQNIQRDNMKNDYCKSHNIKLIRIPYTKTNDEIKQIVYSVLESVTTTGVA